MLPLVVRAVISGILAGFVAIGVTAAVEHFGGLIGGVMGTTPTTIIAAVIGIALKDNEDDLETAMFVVPLGMALNVIVLYLWKIGPKYLPAGASLMKQLTIMMTVSLTFWGVAAALLVLLIEELKSQGAPIPIIGLLVQIVATTWGAIVACLKPPPTPRGRNPVSLAVYVARGSLATVAIFIAVLISSISDVAAGMVTTFPAIFLTTMIALWVSQGNAVAGGAAANMILGASSVPVFGMCFALVQPALRKGTDLSLDGTIAVGLIVCYAIAVLFVSVPVAVLLRRRQHAYGMQSRAASAVALSSPSEDAAQMAETIEMPTDDSSSDAAIELEKGTVHTNGKS